MFDILFVALNETNYLKKIELYLSTQLKRFFQKMWFPYIPGTSFFEKNCYGRANWCKYNFSNLDVPRQAERTPDASSKKL